MGKSQQFPWSYFLPSIIVANMEVTYVMTPAEWGKPIDVAEQWIHFVDNSVRDSEPKCCNDYQILLNRS